MQERSYTIVGIRHHNWQGERMLTCMEGSLGKRVVLMHEETNDWNREATAAYIDTEMVGYVSNEECRESSAYCDQSASFLLEGYVEKVDLINRQLHVVVTVGDTLPETEEDTTPYEQWEKNYRAIPLMGYTADEQRLLMLRRDLLKLLSADSPMDDTLRRDIDVYQQLMAYDVSREADDARHHIIALMRDSSHAAVRSRAEELAVAVTSLGSPEARERMADYLFRQLPATEEFQRMVGRHAHIDLAELEQQLQLFPHDLYDEYRLSHVHFVSKLYYRRVPQRALRYFLSGLLLIDRQRGCSAVQGRQSAAVADALAYVARLNHCATPEWQEHIQTLWQQLANQFAQRITETHRAKNTTFNRRFICQVVGTLLMQGVYRANVPQTEYTRLLEGNNRPSLRKDINQGVDDDEVKAAIRRLVAERGRAERAIATREVATREVATH